jgi:hypothetical protein
MRRLDKTETQLAMLMDAEQLDRDAMKRKIDEVIRARGDIERANAMMALEMRAQLTRSQWLHLQDAITYGPEGPYATAFTNEVRELRGTIREFQFTNPNVQIRFVVDTPTGEKEEWIVIWSGAAQLQREGYSRSTFPNGSQVTLRVRPMKDGTKRAGFVASKFADGKVVGRWQ